MTKNKQEPKTNNKNKTMKNETAMMTAGGHSLSFDKRLFLTTLRK
jgi:hypothetical protein